VIIIIIATIVTTTVISLTFSLIRCNRSTPSSTENASVSNSNDNIISDSSTADSSLSAVADKKKTTTLGDLLVTVYDYLHTILKDVERLQRMSEKVRDITVVVTIVAIMMIITDVYYT